MNECRPHSEEKNPHIPGTIFPHVVMLAWAAALLEFFIHAPLYGGQVQKSSSVNEGEAEKSHKPFRNPSLGINENATQLTENSFDRGEIGVGSVLANNSLTRDQTVSTTEDIHGKVRHVIIALRR